MCNQENELEKDQEQVEKQKEEVQAQQPVTGNEEEAAQPAKAEESPENTEEIKVQFGKTKEELKKQKELLLRTAAEYDNYRKRTEREKQAIYSDATSAAVTEFLPVADNLERALAQEDCSVEDLKKGIQMVQSQMNAALSKLGVTAMGEVGEVFSPELHNAVSHIEDENAGENTISQVFQKGYKIDDKVVRHAMVQVAN